MPEPRDRDPLDLDAVDREIRINELEERARELGVASGRASPDCAPEVREEFLRNVIDYESAPLDTRFHQLTSEGIALPPPESLDDAALHAKLWEVIRALAARDAYLYHTDHLSDRELYQHLWSESLREQGPIFPPGSGWVNHIDLIGGGSDEDIEIGLRYYDSEESRRHWARDFPKDVIPPHEDPPHDRDRHLPKAPPPPMMPEGAFDSFRSDDDDDEDSGQPDDT
jgi:hypothetical protein